VLDRRRADHHMGEKDELGGRYPKSRILIHDELKSLPYYLKKKKKEIELLNSVY